jgi:hypothetical protein
MGNSLDSLSPDSLVEFGVQSHIGGSHRFLGKVDHGFDGPGARFLNERPCTRLWRWMVYSRVTTSCSAERVLPPVCSTLMSYDVCARVFQGERTFFLVAVGA